MRDLKEIRKDIDKIDNQLIELFKQRMDCARDVGIYKQANNIPVLNEGRENEILDAVEEKGGEYGASARLLYSNIMELSRALQHILSAAAKSLKALSTMQARIFRQAESRLRIRESRVLTVMRQL